MSEAELDAVVSQLRTDKSLVLTGNPSPRERWGAMKEQLLLGTSGFFGPLDSEAAREEAARHAWYIALDEQVKGPVDIAALRVHWERGELGPDSLCWRKGFEGWQPVCRVQGLVELLAPRPDTAPATPEDLVPDDRAGALDFPLKGAEALRTLAEELPPPLPKRVSLPPPVLELEPVMAPELSDEPETWPEAPRAQDAVGAHPVLSTPPPTQVEVRVRGGAWLALGGGLVGGMLVTCGLWLLGLPAALGVSSRGASPETVARASTGAPPSAASPDSASTRTLPAPVASRSAETTQASTGAAALPPAGVSSPGITAPMPALGMPGALAEGALSTTGVSAGTSSSTPLAPRASPVPTGNETVAAPKPTVTLARASMQDPPMQKPARAEALPLPSPEAVERGVHPAAVEEEAAEEEEDDLGLDEDFARELEGPRKRATAAPPRTAWIPPAPASGELPATLAQSDIFSAVLANKGDIEACVAAQKLASGDGDKRAVVRWTILPSGKVTEVVTETAAFRGTPLALCLEGKIRSWTFPRHREQGGPVRFPFVF